MVMRKVTVAAVSIVFVLALCGAAWAEQTVGKNPAGQGSKQGGHMLSGTIGKTPVGGQRPGASKEVPKVVTTQSGGRHVGLADFFSWSRPSRPSYSSGSIVYDDDYGLGFSFQYGRPYPYYRPFTYFISEPYWYYYPPVVYPPVVYPPVVYPPVVYIPPPVTWFPDWYWYPWFPPEYHFQSHIYIAPRYLYKYRTPRYGYYDYWDYGYNDYGYDARGNPPRGSGGYVGKQTSGSQGGRQQIGKTRSN